MVKCLNIGENIGKPIYRSISNVNIKAYILLKLFYKSNREVQSSLGYPVRRESFNSLSFIIYFYPTVLLSAGTGLKGCL